MCVCVCGHVHACKLFSSHLKDQFTHQSIPLTIRLQAPILVVWSNVDLILKAQVVWQSLQDINGKTLVLLWFPQNILWHHYKWLLLEGKFYKGVSKSIRQPINTPITAALNHLITQVDILPQTNILKFGRRSVRANITNRKGHFQVANNDKTGLCM